MSDFHMSLPCHSVTKTKEFYVDVIGASIGRSASNWVDIDLFSHQLTFCKTGEFNFEFQNYKFEKTILPSFHFGVILNKKDWNKLKDALKDSKHVEIKETLFLSDKSGEHRSFFIKDPNGYYLEFKCFQNGDGVFER